MASDKEDGYPGWLNRVVSDRFAHAAHLQLECAFCGKPPTLEPGMPIWHASSDQPGMEFDFRIVFVALHTEAETPLPSCRDCMRALILHALDLGF